MSRNTIFLILFLLALAAGLGYVKYRLGQSPKVAESPAAPTPTATASTAADSTDVLIASLTPRQKVLQLMAFPVALKNVPALASASARPVATASATSPFSLSTQTFLKQNLAGFVTYFGERLTSETAAQATAQLQTFSNPQLTTVANAQILQPLIAVDHEGGTVQRLSGSGFSRLPSWQSWCQSNSTDKTALVQSSAQELRQVGINIIFGPVVDVATTSSFLRTRLCSSRPAEVARSAQSWGKIFASQGILPVIKHYPGIGSATADLHLGFSPITPSADDQQVFSQILKTYPNWAVMTSHSGATSPCSIDAKCIQNLRQIAPQILLFTDALEMKALQVLPENEASASAVPRPSATIELPADLETLSVAAILAGNDVLVYGNAISAPQFAQIVDHLVAEYTSNPIFQAQVDEHLRRVLNYKIMLRK